MTIAGRLVCYAMVTAGSLAAGGISVGWLMNPDRVATTAAIEQPQSVEPPITERKPAVLYAVPEGRGPPSATAAAPTVTTREMPASLPLQPPLALRHKALEQPGSQYKIIKVTRGPHGLRREIIAQSYAVPASPR